MKGFKENVTKSIGVENEEVVTEEEFIGGNCKIEEGESQCTITLQN